jgi:protein-tyrosine-phosphatase
MKKVLIIDIENSTNSVIAKELINRYLRGIKAYSAGVNPVEDIDENTINALELEGIIIENYKRTQLDELLNIDFNLVIAIDDIIDKIADKFPKRTEVISVIFNNPKGEDFEKFIEITKEIKEKLLPIIRKKLS